MSLRPPTVSREEDLSRPHPKSHHDYFSSCSEMMKDVLVPWRSVLQLLTLHDPSCRESAIWHFIASNLHFSVQTNQVGLLCRWFTAGAPGLRGRRGGKKSREGLRRKSSQNLFYSQIWKRWLRESLKLQSERTFSKRSAGNLTGADRLSETEPESREKFPFQDWSMFSINVVKSEDQTDQSLFAATAWKQAQQQIQQLEQVWSGLFGGG